MRIGVSVDSDSDAIGGLVGLLEMQEQELLKNIQLQTVESIVLQNREEISRYGDALKRNLLESYWRAWSGAMGQNLGFMNISPRSVVANNVYRVIKQVVLNNSFQGLLTGSTLKSISTWIEGDTLYGGIRGGSWPIGNRTIRASVSDVVSELDKIYTRRNNSMMDALFGNSVEKSMTAADRMRNWQKNKRVIHQSFREKEAKIGTVKVSWDSTGFRIEWPYKVRQVTGLKNMEFPSEPFGSKVYKGNKQDRFFEFRPWFFSYVGDVMDAFVDRHWGVEVRPEPPVASGVGEQPTTRVEQPKVSLESLTDNFTYDELKSMDLEKNFLDDAEKRRFKGILKTDVVTEQAEREGWSQEQEMATLIRESWKDYKSSQPYDYYKMPHTEVQAFKSEVEQWVHQEVEVKTETRALHMTQTMQKRYQAMVDAAVAKLVRTKQAQKEFLSNF